jgi:phospholipid/cholesterol/gamma-HCH transport system ATP-binding protein
MGIGEKIIFLYKGHKLWEGNSADITNSGIGELDDFVFANKVMSQMRGK